MPALSLLVFVYLILAAFMGHVVGDYILQNQYLALNKSKPGWRGALACTIHVALYTAAVSIFTGLHGLMFLALVAAPHWLIDRYSLGQKWLNFKNRREEVWAPKERPWDYQKGTVENVWQIGFAAPVYIANDNAMHLVCLWVLLWFMTMGLW